MPWWVILPTAAILFSSGLVSGALLASVRREPDVHDLDATYRRGYLDGLVAAQSTAEIAALHRMWARS